MYGLRLRITGRRIRGIVFAPDGAGSKILMRNNETRLNEIEEAFMLFCAIMTGEPADATAKEKEAAQVRFAGLMQGMSDRMAKRNEGKF